MAWSGGGYGGYGGGFGGSFGLLGDVHGHEPLARRASVSGRRSSMSKSSLQGGNRRRSVDREGAEISVERRHRHGVRRARYQSSDYDALEEFVFEPSGWGEHENLKQREYRPPSGNGFEVAVRLPFKAKDIFREFCDAHEPLSMNEEVALVEMLRPGCERTQPFSVGFIKRTQFKSMWLGHTVHELVELDDHPQTKRLKWKILGGSTPFLFAGRKRAPSCDINIDQMHSGSVLRIAYDYEYTTSPYLCIGHIFAFFVKRIATGPSGFKGPHFSRAMMDRGYRSIDDLSATRLQALFKAFAVRRAEARRRKNLPLYDEDEEEADRSFERRKGTRQKLASTITNGLTGGINGIGGITNGLTGGIGNIGGLLKGRRQGRQGSVNNSSETTHATDHRRQPSKRSAASGGSAKTANGDEAKGKDSDGGARDKDRDKDRDRDRDKDRDRDSAGRKRRSSVEFQAKIRQQAQESLKNSRKAEEQERMTEMAFQQHVSRGYVYAYHLEGEGDGIQKAAARRAAAQGVPVVTGVSPSAQRAQPAHANGADDGRKRRSKHGSKSPSSRSPATGSEAPATAGPARGSGRGRTQSPPAGATQDIEDGSNKGGHKPSRAVRFKPPSVRELREPRVTDTQLNEMASRFAVDNRSFANEALERFPSTPLMRPPPSNQPTRDARSLSPTPILRHRDLHNGEPSQHNHHVNGGSRHNRHSR